MEAPGAALEVVVLEVMFRNHPPPGKRLQNYMENHLITIIFHG